jgi:hypothetical protein
MTAAAPAVNAKELVEERASIEFAELAVVPITCLRDKPVSFLPDLLDFAFGVFKKGELEGVTLRFHGVVLVLILELDGVSAIAIVTANSHPK